MPATIAAYIFTIAILISVLFQFALAAGAPWGHLAMGGRFPGKFPRNMRVAAVIQAALLTFLAVVVLSRAAIVVAGLQDISTTLIWVVVAISGLSLAMNLITSSKWERILWTPVALTMTVCSIIVATS